MSTLVIDGHPDSQSLTAAIVQRYAAGHGDAKVLALRDLDFDPHLHFGYRKRTTLEPDLIAAKRALHEADAIVVATPLWWGSVPAVLKGFFDRALLPQQEYRYTPRGFPEGLLPATQGRLILLSDTPGLFAPLGGFPAQKQIVRNTLKFCGVGSVRTTRMLGVKTAGDAKIARWLDTAEQLGAADRNRAKAKPQDIAAEAASSSVVATS